MVSITEFSRLLLVFSLLVFLLSTNAYKKKPPRKKKKNDKNIPPGSPLGPNYCLNQTCENTAVNDVHLLCNCDKYSRTEVYEPKNMTGFRQFTLHWHNHFRNLIAMGEGTMVTAGGEKMPTAADMVAFSWDYVMEDGARCHARKGMYPPVHDGCHSVPMRPDGTSGSQNIFVINGKAKCKTKVHGKTDIPGCDVNIFNEFELLAYTAIWMWYDGLEDLTNLSIIDASYTVPEKSASIRYLVQFLWAESQGVGCGSSRKDRVYHFTCHYFPTGYIPNRRTYKRGPTVSDCPPQYPSNKDVRYKGLCGRSVLPRRPKREFFISYVGTNEGWDPEIDVLTKRGGGFFPRPVPLSSILFVTLVINRFLN